MSISSFTTFIINIILIIFHQDYLERFGLTTTTSAFQTQHQRQRQQQQHSSSSTARSFLLDHNNNDRHDDNNNNIISIRQNLEFIGFCRCRCTKKSFNHHCRSISSSNLYLRSSYNIAEEENEEEEDNIHQNRRWMIERFHCTPESLSNQLEYYRFNDTPTSTLNYRANWLKGRYGFSDKEMNRIVGKYPKLLSMDVESNLEPTSDCLEKVLGKKSLKLMVLKNPTVLISNPDDIEEKVEYIQNRLGLNNLKVKKKIIGRFPSVLSRSLDNIQRRIDWYQQELSLADSDISKMIIKCPPILGYSIEDNIKPTIDWIQQRLALEDEQVSKIIYKCPEILGCSIEENLEPTLEWIQQRLSLTDEQVSKISCRFPSFLGFSIEENLEPTLEWIQQRLSLTDTGLSNLIVLQPELLGCNVTKNLAPKINFYIEAADVEEGTVIGLLGRNPRLFTAGLKRLEHRLQEVREAGLIIDTGCLQRMAKEPPETWDRSLDYQRRKLDKDGQQEELW